MPSLVPEEGAVRAGRSVLVHERRPGGVNIAFMGNIMAEHLIEARRTALVIVDLRNDCLAPDGAYARGGRAIRL